MPDPKSPEVPSPPVTPTEAPRWPEEAPEREPIAPNDPRPKDS